LPVVFTNILQSVVKQPSPLLHSGTQTTVVGVYLSWVQERSACCRAIQNCAFCCSPATRKVLQDMEEVDAASFECRHARESLWHACSALCPCSFCGKRTPRSHEEPDHEPSCSGCFLPKHPDWYKSSVDLPISLKRLRHKKSNICIVYWIEVNLKNLKKTLINHTQLQHKNPRLGTLSRRNMFGTVIP